MYKNMEENMKITEHGIGIKVKGNEKGESG
jgi:hypothetical protein